MKKRHKLYLKLNVMSIVFLFVSFSSVTLAWFAYGDISHLNTEIDVNAWYINLEKDGERVTNQIVISVDEIYPGMETVEEEIDISNLGDADSTIDYKLISARILGEAADNYTVGDSRSPAYVNKIDPDAGFLFYEETNADWEVTKLADYTYKIMALVDSPADASYGNIALFDSEYIAAVGETVTYSGEVVERTTNEIYLSTGGWDSVEGFETLGDRAARTLTHFSVAWNHDFNIRVYDSTNIVAGDYIIVKDLQIESNDHATPFVDGTRVTSLYVEDVLSHEYPFFVNISIDKKYVLAGELGSTIDVTISWPLDSDTDLLDSEWGTNAYLFKESEQALKDADPLYNIRGAIEIVLSVDAEQYLGEFDSADYNYNLGDSILYDVVNDATCVTPSSTCLETVVLDVDNVVGDPYVLLMPTGLTTTAIFNNYTPVYETLTSGWTVENRALHIEDIMNVISKDVNDSYLIRDSLSDAVFGKLGYHTRLATELLKATDYSGYYKFDKTRFNFLTDSSCYWIYNDYDAYNGWAAVDIDSSYGKVYGELKTTSCDVVPVIKVKKTNL